MDDRLYDLIFTDELPPEARRELVMALRHDPSLRKAFQRWRQVQRQLREEINASVPDRKLLVLYALQQSDDEVLSSREAERVQEARLQVEAALEAHPGLQDVIRRIRSEKETFDAVWAAHTRTRPASERSAAKLWRMTSRWQARAAAIVGFLILTAAVYFWVMQSDRSLEHVHTSVNEERSVQLADGSVVHLEEQTRLTYTVSASGEPRYTRLDGTALFEVASDERSFIVETPTATARVVGTTFGVAASADETTVTVADGRVAFSHPDDTVQAVVVSSGYSSRVVGDGSPTEPRAVDLTRELEWSSYLFFRDDTLRNVVARLSSQYDQPVGVDERLADETVTGTFRRDRSLDEILGVIATAVDARLERTSTGGYRLQVVHEQN